MRKYLIVLAFIAAVAAVFTVLNVGTGKNKSTLETGILGYLGITEEEFQKGFDDFRVFMLSSDRSADLAADPFLNSIIEKPRTFHFYHSLMALMMDLKAGKLDEMILPESVGLYLLNRNNLYHTVQSTAILESGVCFGFREDSGELRDSFNSVIKEMEADGTLEKLRNKYISVSSGREPVPARPDKINDADELKIAVTGDMPPIDMFAGDGKPSGYNTAILTEIGRRLGKNITFINTEAGGRSAALVSGRADVVFWYRATQSCIEGQDPLDEIFKDAPEGINLSMPYYSWGREIIIRMKKSGEY